ncbi:MAG: PaREP1 family protein [Chloroflexi bacterium]|nr:PaREP1 family protein [Chloroflexota bacterium]
MTSAAEEQSATSREMLAKAGEALAANDLLQASEKGWGAAAHMVKGLAESRGWSHDGHRALYEAINRLAQETGDSQIRVLFSVASALHSNFYENWMPKEMVADDLVQVTELLRKLEPNS